MGHYIMRLDDACEKRDVEKWNRIENLLDKYGVKPLVGIIPCCQDTDMDKYPEDPDFWNRVKKWQDKGWTMALHGYHHVFCTKEGGVNPVNHYSEFAGICFEAQKEKISKGLAILKKHQIEPQVFFAPAHTYDDNTIKAIKACSNIRFISDTVANDVYCGRGGLTYIPQQSGKVRKLPFKTVTFCYHPNIMKDDEFEKLDQFMDKNIRYFYNQKLCESNRKISVLDRLLSVIYYARR